LIAQVKLEAADQVIEVTRRTRRTEERRAIAADLELDPLGERELDEQRTDCCSEGDCNLRNK